MTWDDQLLLIWIVSAVVACSAIVCVLIWAIRSGQFRRQDHAGQLPLESYIPTEGGSQDLPQKEAEAEQEHV